MIEAPIAETPVAEATVAEAPAADVPAAVAPAGEAAEAVPAEAVPEAAEQETASEDVEKAEAPAQAAAPATEEAYEIVPAMGGRKLQETIRKLREEWKATDQGGAPNHGLWKRFDRACNEAHKFVEQWLTTVRAEAAAHKAERLLLIEEVKAWGAKNAGAGEG